MKLSNNCFFLQIRRQVFNQSKLKAKSSNYLTKIPLVRQSKTPAFSKYFLYSSLLESAAYSTNQLCS